MELLAPARRLETAYAAFEGGADAVFIGVPGFNARRMMNEVKMEELAKLTKYAHAEGKKVYGALNVLVKNIELNRLIDTMGYVDDIGLDSLIFHDTSVMEVANRYFPNIELHASTQTAITNSKAINELYKFGVKRVILPREVDYASLQELKKNIPKDAELEVFAHGALCHSVSGHCMFSGMYTGKSGNRGMCIQICRKDFKDKQKQEVLPFSMKDLFLGSEIKHLRGLVDSIKIEGRLKSPDWVYNVSKYYRELIDTGKENKEVQNRVSALFSREKSKGLMFDTLNLTTKFSKHKGVKFGSITGVKNNRVGAHLTERVNIHDGIFVERLGKSFSVNKIFKGKKAINFGQKGEKVDLMLKDCDKIFRDDKFYLLSSNSKVFKYEQYMQQRTKTTVKLKAVKSGESSVNLKFYYGDEEVADKTLELSNDLAKSDITDKVKNVLCETGNNDFDVKVIQFEKIKNFVQLSEVKNFKRELYTEIEEKVKIAKENKIAAIKAFYEKNESCGKAFPKRVLFDEVIDINEALEDWKDFEVVVDYKNILMFKDSITDEMRERVIVGNPAIIWEKELPKYDADVQEIVKLGFNKFYCNSVNTLAVVLDYVDCKDENIDIYGGPFLYTLNSASYKFYKENYNIKNFVIPYEFNIDNKIEGDFYRVMRTDVLPLFAQTKMKEGEYYQKEFGDNFKVRHSLIHNESVLNPTIPFRYHRPEEKFGNQYEYINYRKDIDEKERAANYSFKIY